MRNGTKRPWRAVVLAMSTMVFDMCLGGARPPVPKDPAHQGDAGKDAQASRVIVASGERALS